MCRIKVFFTDDKSSLKEFWAIIDREKSPSMETPYYVKAQVKDNDLILELQYAQNTIQTESLNVGQWNLIIGESTGRIFCSILKNFKNAEIDVLKCISKRKKQSNWSDIKYQNICTGIEISETIAQKIRSKDFD